MKSSSVRLVKNFSYQRSLLDSATEKLRIGDRITLNLASSYLCDYT
ncbi:hypothetical protein [Nostoc sp.]